MYVFIIAKSVTNHKKPYKCDKSKILEIITCTFCILHMTYPTLPFYFRSSSRVDAT